uniref:NADH-ubiquinone oxidoreductase chain 6 n=2 Tax=Oryctolagus cuniculus TaxID=9986 RepID=NU6M_RABIT|nr:NADH dehydrogenase subunit 6 [Oryctolagus cuniculus]O79438.1 RecName: Full=NADH-ubiquinone oxidoreductase chain 6; AltName: Full=NADH dehydrogenase subunit 6 [Oryctolagus cuniculus]AZM31685.1 NADH dehydrogenase subunit 6 [Oryctolagus cuniculus]QNO34270.1 NADH dehydrogenase subunit 6 [Oryctolagus cuniculus]QSQ71409.1 NADH dehydrogenase subunit 6 [Oryctolagus cuniculus]CAA04858.1 NADH dehydrogenase subunit 6 [Oryctolagus cuniculus]
MTYVVFLLSVMFVMGFVGFSSKPSPIYGGLGLIVSGGVGCGIVLSFGGSFLGLMMFLIYLGGMLVVFGYTTAMATEEYPETWGSNVMILGMFVLGVLMEVGLVVYMVMSDGVEIVVDFKNMGDWVVFEGDEVGLIREDSMGVAALYSYGSWLMVVAGWSLFVSIFIVIEITRGA